MTDRIVPPQICLRLARAMGGDIFTESEGEGRGTTVTFWIPITVRLHPTARLLSFCLMICSAPQPKTRTLVF